jgi:uncharacterized cofD-like protein
VPNIHSAVLEAIHSFAAIVIGPGSFYTSLMPILVVRGVAEALRIASGPLVLATNILTEGRGMKGFTAGEAVRRVSEAIGRPVDVVIANDTAPSNEVLARYAVEEKELLTVGNVPERCELVTGNFWQGQIARHERRRLAYAVWSVIGQCLSRSE